MARQAAERDPIPFVLRCAVPLGTDVFLVPDAGSGALVRVHDRLYADAPAAELRLDLPATCDGARRD